MGKVYSFDADIIGVTVKEHYRSQSGQGIDYFLSDSLADLAVNEKKWLKSEGK